MKTKTKIIKTFLEDQEAATIKALSKKIKADYRITHTAVQRLLNQDILSLKKVGNNSLCSLNPSCYGLEIYQAEEERKQALLQNQNIRQLYKDLINKIESSHFTFLLFGPYLKNQKTSQDINLLFVSNDINFRKRIEETVSLIPLRINFEVLTEEEFRKLRYSPDKNPVKEALRQNIILHGVESYYGLLRR